VTDAPLAGTGIWRATGLTQAEMRALFRIVVGRPLPAASDAITTPEAVLILAAGLLKGYGFDPMAVLTLAARLWTWLGDDPQRTLLFNVIDRRYVGWRCQGRRIIVDMATGDEITQERELPHVLESVAYNLYELLERRLALVRGERTALWEGRDAPRPTPLGTPPEGGESLGRPPVLRDDADAPVP
jgi:hypothetical protein